MDRTTRSSVREVITDIADRFGYELTRVLVFGSRARGDYSDESDLDVIIVSTDFEGVPFYRRSRLFYRHWNYDELPGPEFVCLTPAEFRERQQANHPTIVQTALRDGIDLVRLPES